MGDGFKWTTFCNCLVVYCYDPWFKITSLCAIGRSSKWTVRDTTVFKVPFMEQDLVISSCICDQEISYTIVIELRTRAQFHRAAKAQQTCAYKHLWLIGLEFPLWLRGRGAFHVAKGTFVGKSQSIWKTFRGEPIKAQQRTWPPCNSRPGLPAILCNICDWSSAQFHQAEDF